MLALSLVKTPNVAAVPFAAFVIAVVFVSVGTTQVASSRRNLVVPAVVDGAGTSPAAAVDPDFTKGEYVVFVSTGTDQVASSRRNLFVPAVVEGVGTSPAAAVDPDFTNAEYVVLSSFCVMYAFPLASTNTARFAPLVVNPVFTPPKVAAAAVGKV
jgi:hypothetical protein